jgi:hypothetical protein
MEFRKQVKVGIAMLGLLAGVAAAQDDAFKKPLSRSKEKAAEGSSTTQIVMQDGDDTYELSIANGEMTAKVNGKKVPAERVRRTKDKVEILDKDGDVLKSFDVSGTENGAWRVIGRGGGAGGGAGGAMGGLFDPDMPKPKVMIGITMSEGEDGVVVEHVYEGMPASKAGLKAQDVIIEVDGAKNLDQKAFREALNKKDAGEKVKLKVKRDGEEKSITIELQKFDQEKFGQGSPFVWRNDMKGMEEAFKDHPEAFEKWQETLKNMPQGQAWVFGQGPEGGMRFTPYSAGPDGKRVQELDRKIAELDEKLSKINEQMERLEKLITKLSERGGGR